ncbi:hypothetical protein PVW51_09140 [Sulfitobacter sp. PR48]|nr:hypothetical protein [Sulfitobacter sp. PR48]MDD9720858.1 hypothetical protein [Sulfitobacter sp. PR48]
MKHTPGLSVRKSLWLFVLRTAKALPIPVPLLPTAQAFGKELLQIPI